MNLVVVGCELDYKLGVISQERLKIEVKLLLSANRKSYMPRKLVQQRMTFSDLEWPFYALRALTELAAGVLGLYRLYLICHLSAIHTLGAH